MSKPDSITRHPLTVRLCHWLIAGSGLLLTFSGIGFMPLYGRFYLNEVPGMRWVSDFQVQMTLHYVSAAIFMAACLFHLVYHTRRQEFSLLPKRGDLRESVEIVKALLSKGPEPAHGKFLAEQRLAYAAIVLTAFVLTVTGYFLAAKHSLAIFVNPQFLQVVILVHLAFTFVFIFLVGLHLVAFLLKANRPLLMTMVHGKVSSSYADKRHPKWQPDED